MSKIPYFEDVVRFYLHYSMKELFPPDTDNKNIVYLIGFFHLLGAIIILYAPYFLVPPFLIFYIIFVIINLIGYQIFNNRCFMTLLSCYYGNKKNKPLKIRWTTFKNVLKFNLFISILGYFFPTLAPINWYTLLFNF